MNETSESSRSENGNTVSPDVRSHDRGGNPAPQDARSRDRSGNPASQDVKSRDCTSGVQVNDEDFDGLKTLFDTTDCFDCQTGEVNAVDVDNLSSANLIKLQSNDPELKPYYDFVVPDNQISTERRCFYLHNGLLMRKFRYLDTPANAVWDVHYQIVVPQSVRQRLIQMAHEGLHAHLGIKKTVTYLQKYFYWKNMWNDVRKYCKCCQVCQRTGKPNQVLKPVPLNPIPVVSEPFSKIIIDCVGPLPKTRKQNQYMLTVMCSSIRYPDAYPLRNISAKSLIPCLIKVFTQYGIPRIIQSDQGSNFTSKLFKDAMRAMGVKQKFSSVYHPESQGALERFHQTLKECLTKGAFRNALLKLPGASLHKVNFETANSVSGC